MDSITGHEQLFAQYVLELRKAKEFAERWWAQLEDHERLQAGSSQEVDRRLKRRWPNGPASHPRVLAVVRKYWLACDALNESIEGKDIRKRAESEPEPEYILAPGLTSAEEQEEMEPEEDEAVYPHVFVLELLMDGDHDDLAAFLSTLSYWPVGVDRDDRFT